MKFVLIALFSFAAACSGSDKTSVPQVDASVPPDGESLDFMAVCDPAADRCDTAQMEFCHLFNNKGPHCSKDCVVASDCPAPSTGCNGMGVCKAP